MVKIVPAAVQQLLHEQQRGYETKMQQPFTSAVEFSPSITFSSNLKSSEPVELSTGPWSVSTLSRTSESTAELSQHPRRRWQQQQQQQQPLLTMIYLSTHIIIQNFARTNSNTGVSAGPHHD
ncbi:unnamed protein product [Trichogramma brassicae]|uniref:Uncharacterized protein n=1 Tax=Trichogramma brassicae TaxID=86971 RepID=A0A6H5IB84_9HYME|nr:unnamed protein product [Trichogramma brassicae]